MSSLGLSAYTRHLLNFHFLLASRLGGASRFRNGVRVRFRGSEAALRVGFHSLGLKEIVSFAAVGNLRSRAVMERLGMWESGTFDHPQVPEGLGLRRHCLYRLARETHAA